MTIANAVRFLLDPQTMTLKSHEVLEVTETITVPELAPAFLDTYLNKGTCMVDGLIAVHFLDDGSALEVFARPGPEAFCFEITLETEGFDYVAEIDKQQKYVEGSTQSTSVYTDGCKFQIRFDPRGLQAELYNQENGNVQV